MDRIFASMLALVTAALLAGCASTAAPAALPEPVLVTVEPTQAAQNTTLGRGDVQLLPTMPASFEVQVPAGARHLMAHAEFTQGAFTTLSVDVAGCGTAVFNVVFASVESGIGSKLACETPTEGTQAVTVTSDGQAIGTITLVALV